MKTVIETYRWKVLAVGVFLLSLWFVFEMLAPALEQTTGLYVHLQNQQEKIVSAENWEQKLARFARQEERLDAFFSDFSVSISNNDRMSTIVELVFNQARKAGVRVRQIRPLDRVESDAYTEIPVTVRIEGRFHNFASFASNLEQAKQLIKLTRLSILVPDGTTDIGSPVLMGELVIHVAAIHHNENTGVNEDG